MEIEEYKNIFELEGDHWWYRGMRKISFSLLNKYLKNRNLKILDAGCGTGFNLLKLKTLQKINPYFWQARFYAAPRLFYMARLLNLFF